MSFPRFRAGFYVSLVLLLLTFVMISWGGVVKNTGSSLACPDWPLCLGQLMPDTTVLSPADAKGVFWEHGHRTIGAVMGLLTIALVVLCWPRHPQGYSLRAAAFALLPIVIVQGLLGAWTVVKEIIPLVSTFHLGLSMIYFMLVLRLCRRLYLASNSSRLEALPRLSPSLLRPASGVLHMALGIVFLQILVGAAVRHLGAHMSAGFGWQFSLIGMDGLGNHSFWPEGGPARLNMFHRYFAFVTAAVVIFAAVRVWSLLGERLPVHVAFQLVLPVGFVVLQILAGVVMLGLIAEAEILMRTIHLAIGTLLLAFQAYAMFRVKELIWVGKLDATPQSGGKGARVGTLAGSQASA